MIMLIGPVLIIHTGKNSDEGGAWLTKHIGYWQACTLFPIPEQYQVIKLPGPLNKKNKNPTF